MPSTQRVYYQRGLLGVPQKTADAIRAMLITVHHPRNRRKEINLICKKTHSTQDGNKNITHDNKYNNHNPWSITFAVAVAARWSASLASHFCRVLHWSTNQISKPVTSERGKDWRKREYSRMPRPCGRGNIQIEGPPLSRRAHVVLVKGGARSGKSGEILLLWSLQEFQSLVPCVERRHASIRTHKHTHTHTHTLSLSLSHTPLNPLPPTHAHTHIHTGNLAKPDTVLSIWMLPLENSEDAFIPMHMCTWHRIAHAQYELWHMRTMSHTHLWVGDVCILVNIHLHACMHHATCVHKNSLPIMRVGSASTWIYIIYIKKMRLHV